MAVMKILQYPDETLHVPGEVVSTFDALLRQQVADMFETLYRSEHCAALAATQLGLLRRITVIDCSDDKNQPLCLINPEILECHGKQTVMEGCMSIPNIHQKVTRDLKIRVRYQDVSGVHHVIEAEGFLAQCIQHELDHLDGILFLERLTPSRKLLLQPKLARLRAQM